jgi:hypothetical protein
MDQEYNRLVAVAVVVEVKVFSQLAPPVMAAVLEAEAEAEAAPLILYTLQTAVTAALPLASSSHGDL